MEKPPSPAEAAALWEKRSRGVLPHIDIAGTDFTIDWRLKELRETAAPWNSINLRDLDLSRDGLQYLFFYDTMRHAVYQVDFDLKVLPQDVVLAEIPYELRLDPVAVAQEYRADAAELLRAYPIQQDLKAVIKPLSASGLPDLVRQNPLKAADRPGNHPQDERQPLKR